MAQEQALGRLGARQSYLLSKSKIVQKKYSRKGISTTNGILQKKMKTIHPDSQALPADNTDLF